MGAIHLRIQEAYALKRGKVYVNLSIYFGGLGIRLLDEMNDIMMSKVT